MKLSLASVMGFALILASCAAPIATPPGPDLFDTAWDDRSVFRAGLISAERAVLDELPHASIYHIEFQIGARPNRITGSQEVRYTNAEDIVLDEVHLRLFPNILGGEMRVSNVTVDGQPVSPRLELMESLLILPLATPLEPGDSLILGMDFAVTVPRSVRLHHGVLAYFDGVLTLAHAYPMIAVYDDEGWNAEIPSESGDVTYADAAFYLVKITASKELTLVTSGNEVSRAEVGRFQFLSVASGPARDFYLAGSKDYEELTRTIGETTLRSYATRAARQGSQLALDTAARAIEIFSARYTPFPYTELDIVSTPTSALGVEYPGIIAIKSGIYNLDSQYRGAPASIYLESTVAHEVGHQWFYNLVGGDQLDDPWLDEALTQFVTLQYYADAYGTEGEAGFRDSLESRWSRVDREAMPIGLPVEAYSAEQYSAIVYGRGPLFFVALRETMGSSSFDAFIRDYSETLAWDIAEPGDVRSLAEQHCACKLDQIFREWVHP